MPNQPSTSSTSASHTPAATAVPTIGTMVFMAALGAAYALSSTPRMKEIHDTVGVTLAHC
jgi:hypothetical protein